jgi:hypothetical protein
MATSAGILDVVLQYLGYSGEFSLLVSPSGSNTNSVILPKGNRHAHGNSFPSQSSHDILVSVHQDRQQSVALANSLLTIYLQHRTPLASTKPTMNPAHYSTKPPPTSHGSVLSKPSSCFWWAPSPAHSTIAATSASS